MHVPKTAGSSLLDAMSAAIPHPAAFGFDRVLFGDFHDFASLAPAVRQVVHLSPKDLPDTGLIAGHIAASSLRQRYPQAQFVTVLREPVCRLLSHWLFWRGHTDDRLAEWGSWAERVRLSRQHLAGFLGAKPVACQNDNLLTRMLLWPHRLIPDGDFIDDVNDGRLLAEARTSLAHFDRVELVEDPVLLDRLGGWLGCTLTLPRLNETPSMPPSLRGSLATALDHEALALLQRCCRLDIALWRDVALDRVASPEHLRERTLLGQVARAANLLSGASLHSDT